MSPPFRLFSKTFPFHYKDTYTPRMGDYTFRLANVNRKNGKIYASASAEAFFSYRFANCAGSVAFVSAAS